MRRWIMYCSQQFPASLRIPLNQENSSRLVVRRRKLINTPTQASMHPAQLVRNMLLTSSVKWLAIRPSRALLDGRLVT